LSEATIDATDGIIRALDFDQEDGLLETRLSSEFRSEEHTSSSGGDLTTTSVNSISVECYVLNVEADSSHVFISHDTLLGGPLEGSLARVLDFIHKLTLSGGINKEISTSGLGTETPNLLGIVGIPTVLILQDLVADLDVLLGSNLIGFNAVGELVTHRGSNTENSVVLVR
jgi:hypothetical protein